MLAKNVNNSNTVKYIGLHLKYYFCHIHITTGNPN